MTISVALIEPDENRRQILMRIVHESLGTISSLAVYTFQTARAFHYAFIEKRFRADILLLRADDTHFTFGQQIRDRDTRCVIVFLDGHMDIVLKSLASMPIAYLVRESQPGALRQALRLAHSHLINLDPAIYPPDSKVQITGEPFWYAPEAGRKLLKAYEDVRSFAFSAPCGDGQRRSARDLADLFMHGFPPDLIPYYHALSPDFFQWLGK